MTTSEGDIKVQEVERDRTSRTSQQGTSGS
jgi:hypothetical protein